MAVLTNRGRLISSLSEYDITKPAAPDDLLVIQDISDNITEKITVTNLSTIILQSIAARPVNFNNNSNKFTGSFFVPDTCSLTAFGRTKLGRYSTSTTGVVTPMIDIDSVTQNIGVVSKNIGVVVSQDIGIVCKKFNLSASLAPADGIVLQGNTVITRQLDVNSNIITQGNIFAAGSVTASGEFLGNFKGDVFSDTGVKVLENGSGGVNTAFFYGTASHANSASHALKADTAISCLTSTTISASYSKSGSYADRAKLSNTSSFLNYFSGTNNGSASFAMVAQAAINLLNPINQAVTASYAENSATTDKIAGDTTGNNPGSFNIAFFSQSKVASNAGFFRKTDGSGPGNYQQITISSSRNNNGIVIASRGSGGNNQAYSAYYNLNSSTNLGNWPNVSGYTMGSFFSGSLMFIAPLGSAEFSSSTRVAVGSVTETYGFVSKRSGYYFWPYMNNNTPSRDGSIGIGVHPPDSADTPSALLGKFHIRCFSSSKANVGKVSGKTLTGTVKLPEYAIYVDAGSSSYSPIFSVGASGSNAGDVYVSGDLTVDGLTNINIFQEHTSSLAVNNYKGNKYQYQHHKTHNGVPATPKYFKCVLFCFNVEGDPTIAYAFGDEIDCPSVVTDTNRPAITAWSNSTLIGASFINLDWLANHKLNGTHGSLNPARWKVKFYYA